MGGSWDIPNMSYESGKSKWLVKETRKKCLIKVIQTAMMVQLRDYIFRLIPPMSVHTWCTLCPLNEYSTCFTIFNLCGDSFCNRRAGALVTDRWTSGWIWVALTTVTQPQSHPAGNPSPAQAIAGRPSQPSFPNLLPTGSKQMAFGKALKQVLLSSIFMKTWLFPPYL